MGLRETGEKIDQVLDDAAAKVERQRLTKWFVLGVVALILVIVGMLAWPAHATGWHHTPNFPPIVVKPPVVVPPPAPPPAVTPPTTPNVPAQQPAAGGKSASFWSKGGIVFVGVAIYFGAVIRSHWIFCAQREEEWHKDNKVARCYNAERDGLPR